MPILNLVILFRITKKATILDHWGKQGPRQEDMDLIIIIIITRKEDIDRLIAEDLKELLQQAAQDRAAM